MTRIVYSSEPIAEISDRETRRVYNTKSSPKSLSGSRMQPDDPARRRRPNAIGLVLVCPARLHPCTSHLLHRVRRVSSINKLALALLSPAVHTQQRHIRHTHAVIGRPVEMDGASTRSSAGRLSHAMAARRRRSQSCSCRLGLTKRW